MSATVFVAKPKASHLMLANDSGAAVVDGEFAVVGGIAAVADQAIDSGAVGSFFVEEGAAIDASTLTSGEDTFATLGQIVYWDPSAKKFSDTKTAGYYAVGTLVAIKASGIIRFVKFFRAELVPAAVVLTMADITDLDDLALADLADVTISNPTNNDTLKYDAATSKWVVVAVAD